MTVRYLDVHEELPVDSGHLLPFSRLEKIVRAAKSMADDGDNCEIVIGYGDACVLLKHKEFVELVRLACSYASEWPETSE